MEPRDKPILIYDGDCGFCRKWIDRWQTLTGDRLDYAPYQDVADQFPDVPVGIFKRAVQYVDEDGHRTSAAHAVFRSLTHADGKAWGLWAYQHVPGFAPVTEGVYRWVTGHRGFLDKASRVLWGEDVLPSTYYTSRWLFLRLLGLVYLIAFWSLWSQIHGLVGENGILPAGVYLDNLYGFVGWRAFLVAPTLGWLGAGDGMLTFLCVLGVLASVLLILGFAPIPNLFVLWVSYLSLTTVGQDFLNFQWDALLLETGFLALFFAPLRLWPSLEDERPPSVAVHWLFRWLLFRLLFLSGLAKLLSGDTSWFDLTALAYHYETQPLPLWTSWYVHKFPLWIHQASCSLMFLIELVVPFLFFLPRRPRYLGAFATIFLMVLVGLTGNYGFFNLLAIVLCVLLFDDRFLERYVFRPLRLQIRRPVLALPRLALRRQLLVVPVLFILLLSVIRFREALDPATPLTGPAGRVSAWTQPFRSVNHYGLFRAMTTERPEIIVEGSRDGDTWLAYNFAWKPDDLSGRPRWVQPHMPRLDWQMWFAALRPYEETRWFEPFLARLLEGSPEVTGLLAGNPFPNAPPVYIRAVRYDYAYTDWEQGQLTGNWWTRSEPEPYSPVLFRRETR